MGNVCSRCNNFCSLRGGQQQSFSHYFVYEQCLSCFLFIFRSSSLCFEKDFQTAKDFLSLLKSVVDLFEIFFHFCIFFEPLPRNQACILSKIEKQLEGINSQCAKDETCHNKLYGTESRRMMSLEYQSGRQRNNSQFRFK